MPEKAQSSAPGIGPIMEALGRSVHGDRYEQIRARANKEIRRKLWLRSLAQFVVAILLLLVIFGAVIAALALWNWGAGW